MMSRTCSARSCLLLVVVLVALALVLAACGGSSPKPASTTVASLSPAARRRVATEATATVYEKAHRDVVSRRVRIHHPFPGTGGDEINDDNPGGADAGHNPDAGRLDPCELVSAAQAEAILGGRVATPQEAPLGPTCIYQPVGARTFVTLSLQAVNLAQLKPDIRHLTKLDVDGRTAYCGDYGETTTYVATAHRQILAVAAPCGIGRLFAADALRQPQS